MLLQYIISCFFRLHSVYKLELHDYHASFILIINDIIQRYNKAQKYYVYYYVKFIIINIATIIVMIISC